MEIKFAIRSISAAGLIALCPVTVTLAQSFEVVGRPADHAKKLRPTPEGGVKNEQFRSAMDNVFGPGRWRQTSGYRSEARENELRREGAGTVPVGQISRHSVGTPDAPGAYDVVVDGMSTQSAAVKLRQSGAPFTRVLAEGAHGPEGSHLHIEPGLALASNPAPQAAPPEDVIYLRVVGGRRNPVLARASRTVARNN